MSQTLEAERLGEFVASQFALRHALSAAYIARHSLPLATVSQKMANRFQRGGRLLAAGVGACVTDAQHVSVEFVHPVIVGKRALPALDVSVAPQAMLNSLARPEDMVLTFAPPCGSAMLDQLVEPLRQRGALVLQWPGSLGPFALPPATDDEFIHQELTEVMYHTLWETVHVFFEQQGRGEDVGAAAFLYPFLGAGETAAPATLADVAASIRQKASDDDLLRTTFAAAQTPTFVAATLAVQQRIRQGGTLIAFGNGGSATDANDFVLDCVAPPADIKPIPAISLALEPANISAIANDVGVELMFSRQMIANGRSQDVAIAFSTSGTSKNLCATLREARRRGMLTLALLGGDGGDIGRERLADFALVVPSDYIPRIQEVQASIYHILRLSLARLGAG